MKNKNLKEKMMLKKMKEVLVIIDMVNGFIVDGKMHDKHIEHITPEIIELIEMFLNDKNNEVITFKDAHTLNSKELETFPEHCLKGEKEAKLIDKLIPYEKLMKVFEKNSTSGFVTKKFRKYLLKNQRKIKRFVLVGCCTDICVANFAIPLINYINEYNLDIEVVVPLNAVETYNSPDHNREEYNEMAYKMMKQNGITLVKKYGGEKYGK